MYVCMTVHTSNVYHFSPGLLVIDCGFVKLKAFSPKTSLGRVFTDINLASFPEKLKSFFFFERF